MFAHNIYLQTLVAICFALSSIYAHPADFSYNQIRQPCDNLLNPTLARAEELNSWIQEIRLVLPTGDFPKLQPTYYGLDWDHHYFTKEVDGSELDRYRLRVQGGLIFLGDDQKPLSTNHFWRRMKFGLGHLFSGKEWMYVMTCQGSIFVVPSGLDTRHSTLGSRICVAAAGILVVLKGRLVYINNFSGHYAPKPRTLAFVLHRLNDLGVDLSQTNFGLFDLEEIK